MYQQFGLYEILGFKLLIFKNATVQVCGAWIRIYYILCSKTYSTLGGLFWTPAGSRQAARGARICESLSLYRSRSVPVSKTMQTIYIILYIIYIYHIHIYWFRINMPSYQYGNSHCGDKMIVWSSYLHNGISYTGEISLYWIRLLIPINPVPAHLLISS